MIDPQYPHGKLNDDDEGALQIAIAHEPPQGKRGGRVILRFGKPIAWFGLTPQGAADLANLLIQHARQADPTGTFTLVIGKAAPS